MSSTNFEDGWNLREDGIAAGGKAVAFPGRDETIWLVRAQWPTPDTTGRLILREYEDGSITIERGRVWLPPAESDGDGA